MPHFNNRFARVIDSSLRERIANDIADLDALAAQLLRDVPGDPPQLANKRVRAITDAFRPLDDTASFPARSRSRRLSDAGLTSSAGPARPLVVKSVDLSQLAASDRLLHLLNDTVVLEERIARTVESTPALLHALKAHTIALIAARYVEAPDVRAAYARASSIGGLQDLRLGAPWHVFEGIRHSVDAILGEERVIDGFSVDQILRATETSVSGRVIVDARTLEHLKTWCDVANARFAIEGFSSATRANIFLGLSGTPFFAQTLWAEDGQPILMGETASIILDLIPGLMRARAIREADDLRIGALSCSQTALCLLDMLPAPPEFHQTTLSGQERCLKLFEFRARQFRTIHSELIRLANFRSKLLEKTGPKELFERRRGAARYLAALFEQPLTTSFTLSAQTGLSMRACRAFLSRALGLGHAVPVGRMRRRISVHMFPSFMIHRDRRELPDGQY